MDILKEVFSKIEWQNTIKSITDKGLEKLAVSAMGATLLDLGTIFGLFIALELVDVFTRLIAEAARLYRAMYDPKIVAKRGCLLTYIKNIVAAHHWKFIDSSQLRDGFWSKTITYFLLIFIGFIGDEILAVKHIPPFTLTVFTMLLVCTETLSILENLNECGVSVAGQISSIIKKRKEQIK